MYTANFPFSLALRRSQFKVLGLWSLEEVCALAPKPVSGARLAEKKMVLRALGEAG